MVANDDALGDVEPEAGALPDGLGGEEGVEDARLQLVGYPRPVVADLDAHTLALPARAQRDPPVGTERIDRVVDQVRPNLVQLRARCLDAWQLGVEVADDRYLLLAQLVSQEGQRALRSEERRVGKECRL